MDRDGMAWLAWAANDDARRVDARGAAWVRGVRLDSAPLDVLERLARGEAPAPAPARPRAVPPVVAPANSPASRLPSREARRRAAARAARETRRAGREKRAAKRAAAAELAPVVAPVAPAPAPAPALDVARPRRPSTRLPRIAYREADAARPQVDDDRQDLFDRTWRGIWPGKGRATLLEAFGEWCEAHESDVADALCAFGERAARRLIRDVDREYERREREALQSECYADAAE
jgi:hypothetical protein